MKHPANGIVSCCFAGLEGSGALGIGCQLACLAACIVPITAVTGGAAALTHVLAAGLAASRAGLWTFDLAVSQMLQERVAHREMGAFACAPVLALSHPGARLYWRWPILAGTCSGAGTAPPPC